MYAEIFKDKMGSKELANDKPHVVCIPFPVQSHIKGMLKFAKLLHHRGVHITFVNTEFNHNRFLKSLGPNSLHGLPDFRFETIPDGLQSSDEDTTQNVFLLGEAIRKNFLAPFLELLKKLTQSSTSNNDCPPASHIVSDGWMAFTVPAAEEMGIPVVLFFTMSASSLMGFNQFPTLVEKGLTPLKDESWLTNGFLDQVIDWVPGFEGCSQVSNPRPTAHERRHLPSHQVRPLHTHTYAEILKDKMGSKEVANDKPHIACIPLPVQSHIKGMLKFAKLLHHRGVHITFVNTEFNHNRFLKSLGPNSLHGLPDFQFETIPDGLQSSDEDTTQNVALLGEAVRTNFLAPFRGLLKKLTQSSTSHNDIPPASHIVSDGWIAFTITAAEEMGIPVVLFFTISQAA
ncbi:hypothetical protein DVH24_018670 [Malus domestica]|uniref:Uncharacterized protein n=1 Tax=Malus domestica TaxID=3750 RepID=A0A498HP44_MALDO|nr:hypothetical protein DVH24_018670 [Malus domestica]